jgi:hypothetical protein
MLQKSSETTLSKRAFGKTNADHLSAERPKKKPKIHKDQKTVHTSASKKAFPVSFDFLLE